MNATVKVIAPLTNTRNAMTRLANLRPHLQEIGDLHVKFVQARIEAGVDARGKRLKPIAPMTKAMRQKRGISRDDPLNSTGELKRSMKAHATGKHVIITPTGSFNTKKAGRSIGPFGPESRQGFPSSITKTPVPVRNVFAFVDQEIKILATVLTNRVYGIPLSPLRRSGL